MQSSRTAVSPSPPPCCPLTQAPKQPDLWPWDNLIPAKNSDGRFHGCVGGTGRASVCIYACAQPQPRMCRVKCASSASASASLGATEKGLLTSRLLTSMCGGQHGVLLIVPHSVNRPHAPAYQQGALGPVLSWLRPPRYVEGLLLGL